MAEIDTAAPETTPLVIPNLAGIVTTADIDTKGTGKYAADYVNWAKVAHLLHVHAPGWQFRLQPDADGSIVHRAPNGTGYVVGYFTAPNGTRTAELPQAVMDNRNDPILFEKVTARDVTDTHRRALCTCAAFTFGLAYELWAKEQVENPLRDQDDRGDAPPPPPRGDRSRPQKRMAPAPRSQRAQEDQEEPQGPPKGNGNALAALARQAREVGLSQDGWKTLEQQCGRDGITPALADRLLRAGVLANPDKVAALNAGRPTTEAA